jgi:hypothetical protein
MRARCWLLQAVSRKIECFNTVRICRLGKNCRGSKIRGVCEACRACLSDPHQCPWPSRSIVLRLVLAQAWNRFLAEPWERVAHQNFSFKIARMQRTAPVTTWNDPCPLPTLSARFCRMLFSSFGRVNRNHFSQCPGCGGRWRRRMTTPHIGF